MNGHVYKWMDKWLDGEMSVWVDECTDGQVCDRVDGQTEEWMMMVFFTVFCVAVNAAHILQRAVCSASLAMWERLWVRVLPHLTHTHTVNNMK